RLDSPPRSSRPGGAVTRLDSRQRSAVTRLDSPPRSSRPVLGIAFSIRGWPLWALLRAGDAGALEAVEYGREVGARRGAQRCPEVADAPHARGQRRQREVAIVDARVRLAPGQRRGGP